MSAEEIIQRNELTTLLLRYRYNVFLPVYDEGKVTDSRYSVQRIHPNNQYMKKAPA